MTDVNTTPANGDSTTLLPVHRLAQIEDQLNHLLACHVFYDTAIRAITQLEVDEPTANDRWQLGCFYNNSGYRIRAKPWSLNCGLFGKLCVNNQPNQGTNH